MSTEKAIEQCNNAIKYSGSSETANLARDIKAELLESEPSKNKCPFCNDTGTRFMGIGNDGKKKYAQCHCQEEIDRLEAEQEYKCKKHQSKKSGKACLWCLREVNFTYQKEVQEQREQIEQLQAELKANKLVKEILEKAIPEFISENFILKSKP